MLTDTPLADAVIANLDRDPRIPESLEIAVAADDGIVTLRGTVESSGRCIGGAERHDDHDRRTDREGGLRKFAWANR